MPASDYVPWFQMASTVVTGVGVMVSTTLGIVTLRGTRQERLSKVKPNLLFNLGGQALTCTLEDRDGIPGIDHAAAASFLSNRKTKSPLLCTEQPYGQLFNHGPGPALDVAVWFSADTVRHGDAEYKLSPQRLLDPPYSKEWNTTPTTPTNIASEEGASVYRLPAALCLAEPGITGLSGATFIECSDLENRRYQWQQPTNVFIEWQDDATAMVILSFGRRAD